MSGKRYSTRKFSSPKNREPTKPNNTHTQPNFFAFFDSSNLGKKSTGSTRKREQAKCEKRGWDRRTLHLDEELSLDSSPRLRVVVSPRRGQRVDLIDENNRRLVCARHLKQTPNQPVAERRGCVSNAIKDLTSGPVARSTVWKDSKAQGEKKKTVGCGRECTFPTLRAIC